jgi:hypothetical protein
MELFDRESVLVNQLDQIHQLEEKLKKEQEKLKALEAMFQTGEINEKLLFSSTPCPLKKPYQYLHGLLGPEEAQLARDHFAAASTDKMNADLVRRKHLYFYYLLCFTFLYFDLLLFHLPHCSSCRSTLSSM